MNYLDSVNVDPELAARNAERLEKSKLALGTKYLLHPANKVSRLSKTTIPASCLDAMKKNKK